MKMTKLSVCGVNCSTDCRAYKTECDGCNELQGKVSWAVFYGKEHCPIYACAKESGFASCGDCGMAPCSIWYNTKSPKMSDSEFEADITSRINNLKLRTKENS